MKPNLIFYAKVLALIAPPVFGAPTTIQLDKRIASASNSINTDPTSTYTDPTSTYTGSASTPTSPTLTPTSSVSNPDLSPSTPIPSTETSTYTLSTVTYLDTTSTFYSTTIITFSGSTSGDTAAVTSGYTTTNSLPSGTLPITGVSPATSSYSVGTCASSDVSATATSCPMPTTTPYNNYLYPDVAFDAGCHMIELCNDISFNGACLSVPIYVNGSEAASCDYLDLTRSCINFPFQFDSGFSSFQEYYDKTLVTVSVRAGNDLSCEVFPTPYCETEGWAFGYKGIYDLTSIFSYHNGDNPVAISSFRCWPEDEQAPVWGQTSIMTLTPSPTSIVVAPSAAASLGAFLQNDFNPFIDQVLFCQNFGPGNCTAMNSSATCMAPMSGQYLPAYVATGYDYICNVYNDSTCDSAVVSFSEHSATRLDRLFDESAIDQSDWSFKCWNRFCASESDYAKCASTKAVPTGTVTTTLTPLSVTSFPATMYSWSTFSVTGPLSSISLSESFSASATPTNTATSTTETSKPCPTTSLTTYSTPYKTTHTDGTTSVLFKTVTSSVTVTTC